MRLFTIVVILAIFMSCTEQNGGPNVNQLPETQQTLVVRADFSDDAEWAKVRAEIETPAPILGFRPDVEFLDDRRHDGYTAEQLLTLVGDDPDQAVIFLVDQTTLSQPDHPVLVVDLWAERGRSFRVIPSAMWMVENNLSLANADWEDFADYVDADGVFRGLPQ